MNIAKYARMCIVNKTIFWNIIQSSRLIEFFSHKKSLFCIFYILQRYILKLSTPTHIYNTLMCARRYWNSWYILTLFLHKYMTRFVYAYITCTYNKPFPPLYDLMLFQRPAHTKIIARWKLLYRGLCPLHLLTYAQCYCVPHMFICGCKLFKTFLQPAPSVCELYVHIVFRTINLNQYYLLSNILCDDRSKPQNGFPFTRTYIPT